MSQTLSSLAPRPPGSVAADALVRAGLLPAEHAPAAASLLARHLAPASFPFEADAVYLQHCLSFHVGSHFRQVMEPAAKSHRTTAKLTGKMFSDAEVEKAATEIVAIVAGELSPAYTEHMYKYFGDLEGLAAYLYSRVRGVLIEEALRYNNEFLDKINKGRAGDAIAGANARAAQQ